MPGQNSDQGAGRRPGMMDVARRAGVSHQTVSRVINNPDSVRPATLAKVRSAIKELGYQPNLAARALVTDSSRVIGVVTADASFFGPASMSAAVEVAARRAGYGTMVATLPTAEVDQIDAALTFLLGRGVDGIIAVAPGEGLAQAARSAAQQVPVVVVAAGFQSGEGVHVVSVDQYLGARMATAHLLATGRRNIAHITGPLDWFDARARLDGWASALEDEGLPRGQVIQGDWSPAAGHAALAALLAHGPLPDAVFCGNDLMALGLMSAARDQGVRIPEDLAVVGFDDIEGAGYFYPPLSTVRQPFDEVGRTAVEVLFQAFDGAAATCHSIPPQLRVRATS